MISKIIVFLVLAFFSNFSLAEYYLARPSTVYSECSDCHPKKRQTLGKKHYLKYHKNRRHRHVYAIEVYYPQEPCSCCEYVVQEAKSNDNVTFSHRPVDRYQHTLSMSDFSPNKDMSTGDDNATKHPDMQIN